MMWRFADRELPLVKVEVLTFGYLAPDGRDRVTVEHLMHDQRGVPHWSRSDVVTHWCYVSDVPTPEDES